MTLTTMYPGINNSPKTALSQALAADATQMSVESVAGFPAAPNLAVIGDGDDAEVVRYNGITGQVLTGLERGFDGTTASAWAAGIGVARNFTKYDHNTFLANITNHETRVTVIETNKPNTADLGNLAFLNTVGASEIEAEAATNEKLTKMASKTIKGNETSASAAPQDLTASQARTLLNVEDGSQKNPSFEATTTNIKMNGTQTVGSLGTVPRADHVHPTDTSRAPVVSPAFSGTPSAPTAAAKTDTTQIATTAFVMTEKSDLMTLINKMAT